MSNPKKKNGAKNPKQKSKKAEQKPEPTGRLVALDGVSGPFLVTESQRLAHLCSGADAAWSQFDASNTFHELGMAKAKTLTPTPRVLVLLYASDLLFRLRWEIQPALEEGRTVVAAPYVETATAFGVAAGLPKEWLDDLFIFAPKPVACLRLKEKKKVKGDKKPDKKKGDMDILGFVEFCSATLVKNSPGWDAADIRAGMIQYFKGLEERDGICKFGKKLPKSMLKA